MQITITTTLLALQSLYPAFPESETLQKSEFEFQMAEAARREKERKLEAKRLELQKKIEAKRLDIAREY